MRELLHFPIFLIYSIKPRIGRFSLFLKDKPQWLWLLFVLKRWFCDVDSLLIISIEGFCNCSMFCSALLFVYSSLVIILMEKGELVDLHCLSSRCLVIVAWLFLAMSRGLSADCDCGIFDHTHLLFSRLFTI